MFVQQGIVDDVTTNVKFAYFDNKDYEIVATLPHFWEYCGSYFVPFLISLLILSSELGVVYYVAQDRDETDELGKSDSKKPCIFFERGRLIISLILLRVQNNLVYCRCLCSWRVPYYCGT